MKTASTTPELRPSRVRSRLSGLADQRGFTLIELLVVIMLIGILASIAIASYLSQANKGQDLAAKGQVRSLQGQVEACALEHKENFTNCNTEAELGDALTGIDVRRPHGDAGAGQGHRGRGGREDLHDQGRLEVGPRVHGRAQERRLGRAHLRDQGQGRLSRRGRHGGLVKARLHARVAAEGGWTLVELLVAMAIFTFVLGAALSLFEVGVKSAPKDQERAIAVRDGQTFLSGMTREVRNAYDIVELTPNVIDFLVTRQGVHKRVRYECGVTDTALRKCQRSEVTLASATVDPLPATGTPRKVLGRMVNGTAADPVFSYTMPAMEPLDREDLPSDYPEANQVCDFTPSDFVAGDPPRMCFPAPWPVYIGVKIKVPAKGEQKPACNDAGTRVDCYRFNVSWSDSIYMRNLESKQSAYNSGG